MSKRRARTLSCTFAPALIALVGFGGATLSAIEPEDAPAKSARTAGAVDASATADQHKKDSAKPHKHHHHHHHKSQAGRP
jgi:hypothetical protein